MRNVEVSSQLVPIEFKSGLSYMKHTAVWCHPWTKTDWQDSDVFTQTFILDLKFLLNLLLLLPRKVDKLASLTPAYRSFPVSVCSFLRTWQTKLFDISTEYIKRVNKVLGWNIFRKMSGIWISFYRFKFIFMYHERSIFCVSQPVQ